MSSASNPAPAVGGFQSQSKIFSESESVGDNHTEGADVNTAGTPIARSLKQHRPSILSIPPRQGRTYQPVGFRSVQEAPTTALAANQPYFTSNAVLTPATVARHSSVSGSQGGVTAATATATGGAGRTSSPGTDADSDLSRNERAGAQEFNLSIAAGLSGLVGLAAAILGSALSLSNVDDVFSIETGLLMAIGGCFGARALFLLSEELEASQQQKRWRRGQREFVLFSLISSIVAVLTIVVPWIGTPHTNPSVPSSEKCDSRVVGLYTRYVEGCDSDSTSIARLLVNLVVVATAIFSTVVSFKFFSFQRKHEMKEIELRLRLSRIPNASTSSQSVTSVSTRSQESRFLSGVTIHSRMASFLVLLQTVGTVPFLTFGPLFDQNQELVITMVVLSVLSTVALLAAIRVSKSRAVLLVSYLLSAVLIINSSLMFALFKFSQKDSMVCAAITSTSARPSYCSDLLKSRKAVMVGLVSTLVVVATIVCVYNCIRLHARLRSLEHLRSNSKTPASADHVPANPARVTPQ